MVATDLSPRVVVIGGGSGSSATLSGLKAHRVDLTAIVTAFDSGGSSGILRREFGFPPLGDLRQCLVALSEDGRGTDSLRWASEFRFDAESSLNGHSLGNLLLAALTAFRNDVEGAIEEMSRMLKIRGQVIPVSLGHADLCAELDDGTVLREESKIDLRGADNPRIKRIFLSPVVPANPRAIAAIESADAIVMGPGDLYTSILPNLLVSGIPEAIRASSATKIYVCNLMTKRGETGGFRASDFLGEVTSYLGVNSLDWALMNNRPVPDEPRRRYFTEGAEPVEIDPSRVRKFTRHHMAVALTDRESVKMRHDPERLAEALLSVMRCATSDQEVPGFSPWSAGPVVRGIAD